MALLSIHPALANRLLSGEKQVEFRKRRFATDVSHVVIYATAPLHCVLGYFEVSDIEHGSPSCLWRRHRGSAGINYKEFQAYYGACRTGIAIIVGRVFTLKTPLRLKAIHGSLIAPQSFTYLSPHVLGRIADKIMI